jgi:nitroreductase
MLLKEEWERVDGAGELDTASVDRLFREARTHSAWLDRPVAEEKLREVYDLMKYGPTSANSSPARIVFLRRRGGARSLSADPQSERRRPS